ncbi:coiled-coil domain-containing protein 34-like [Ochlerotatus camptorhynchus]|uniref:coiled-coil domain-containing protein 34-like n=1 Tax=Ochlerotatus camptorhynchus TaxID=644619 RepID=UPI0031D11515
MIISSTLIAKLLPKRKEYDPEAYQNWLEAKNEAECKRKEKELKRKKLDEIKKKLAEEKRRQESEEKLKRWMERKELETQKMKNQAENGNEKVRKKWIPNEVSETTFKAWKNRVKQLEEDRKLRQLAEQRMQEELKQERQYVSKLFYEGWLKSSSSKPKPVPLNQGIDSFRGSISKMFINPVPWKNNID